MKDLDKIAKEYGFEVSRIQQYAHIRKSLDLNPEFDVAVRQGESERYFGSRCYPVGKGLSIWGRGADLLHETLAEDLRFQNGSTNLISDYRAKIELSKGGILISVWASNLDVDTARMRLFFIDAARFSDGMLAAAKSYPVGEPVPRSGGGPTSLRNMMPWILIGLALFWGLLKPHH